MKRLIVNTLVIMSMSFLVMSCGAPKEQSSTTGWYYNDPKWGGFEVQNSYNEQIPPGTVFIQGGSFVMGRNDEDMFYDYNNIPRKVTVSSFYMDEVETRNKDYRNYLYWLEQVYGEEYPEVVRQAEPDEFVWRNVGSYREDMVDNYFRHPAYQDYPVVGVTWEQAVDYCAWRTDRVNEKILIDKGIFDKLDLQQTPDNNFNTDAYLAGQYSGIIKRELKDLNPAAGAKATRIVKLEDGILLPKFRLPTEAEWEYAAYALQGNTFDERIVERRVYPWNGSNVRSGRSEYMGEMMANFQRGRGDYMGVAGYLNDGADYTTNVYSYFPNDYGLYNMAGNVSEWVMDVYRTLTLEDAEGLNAFRGNVYKVKERDEDGYIAEKDSLGRIRYRDVTVEENANRRNYQKADNINYRDGDYASAIVDNWLEVPEGMENTSALSYDYGNTSLISDKARVVKGGSWKDRAYWLSPGTRRYYQQNQSAEWIGFRCAMTKVGTATKNTAKN